MSYIPDCRTNEYYNEKYLNDMDKEIIRGYDWCIKELSCAIDNIDEWTFRDELDVRPSDIVKVAEAMHPFLKDMLESSRNELIVSLIENMDDDEYNKIKQETDSRKTE